MTKLITRMFGRPPAAAAPPNGPPPKADPYTIAGAMAPAEAALVERVRPYTMTSPERVLSLADAVRYLVRAGVPGAFVECGVWRGGSSMAAALTLMEAGDTGRDLYLFDTFEGMPPPTDADRSFDGASAADQLNAAPAGTGVWCLAGLDEVRANMLATGYPADRLHFIPGKVEDTIPAGAPVGDIALLRLDTDWYESTRHELVHLFPRLAPGGVLIIDDYGHWDGARRAADEYFAANNIQILLHRVDYTGRIAVNTHRSAGHGSGVGSP